MLDLDFIRENKEKVAENTRNRKGNVDIDEFLKLDDQRRALTTQAEELRQRRNQHADALKGGQPTPEQIAEGKKIKEELAGVEDQLAKVNVDFKSQYALIPNISSDDTPIGASEDDNQVVSTWGDKTDLGFEPKEHHVVLENLGLLDNDRAVKISGSRFNYHMGDLVLLEMALTKFVFDILTNQETLQKIIDDNGIDTEATPFTPVIPPEIINTEVMAKTGRLEPVEDKYFIGDGEQVLIGSAEASLASLHMDEVLPADKLPIRYAGISSAFRREAGTYGKDTHGMIRVHQFRKLEMESLSVPEKSDTEQQLLVAIQEYIMQQLGLPYQKIAISTGDMGRPDYRQIDLEAWMPAQGKYRETHTSDHTSDYQSRRLNIKFDDGNSKQFVHMNDATAVALSRMPVAIVENYQTQDGRIRVPEVLRQYMNGKEMI